MPRHRRPRCAPIATERRRIRPAMHRTLLSHEDDRRCFLPRTLQGLTGTKYGSNIDWTHRDRSVEGGFFPKQACHLPSDGLRRFRMVCNAVVFRLSCSVQAHATSNVKQSISTRCIWHVLDGHAHILAEYEYKETILAGQLRLPSSNRSMAHIRDAHGDRIPDHHGVRIVHPAHLPFRQYCSTGQQRGQGAAR